MRVWSISPDVIFMGRGDDLGPWTLVCTCGHVCVREFICTHHLNGAFELPSLSSLLPVYQRAIRVYLFSTSVIIINARTLSLSSSSSQAPGCCYVRSAASFDLTPLPDAVTASFFPRLREGSVDAPDLNTSTVSSVRQYKDKVGLGVWCRMLTCQPVFLGSAELLKDRAPTMTSRCVRIYTWHSMSNIT